MKKLCIGLVIMIVLSLLIVGCGGGSPIPTDPTGQINALLDTYAAGVREHNSDKLISCFTDPFTLLGTSMPLAQMKALWDLQFSTTNIVDYQMIERTITIVDSDNATATLKEVLTVEGSPPLTSQLGKFTFVKVGGSWKITAVDLL